MSKQTHCQQVASALVAACASEDPENLDAVLPGLLLHSSEDNAPSSDNLDLQRLIGTRGYGKPRNFTTAYASQAEQSKKPTELRAVAVRLIYENP